MVLAAEERNCDWALTWWALADIPEPATPRGEFRMSYSTKQAIYYGEVRSAPNQIDAEVRFSTVEAVPMWCPVRKQLRRGRVFRKLVEICSAFVKMDGYVAEYSGQSRGERSMPLSSNQLQPRGRTLW